MKGCKNLTIQIGEGKEPKIENDYGISVKIFRLKETIENDIKDADLIIGHAGAGTCLQSLEAGKRLLVVVNDDLMDNHQIELAEKLYDDGHVLLAFCSQLEQLLDSDQICWQLKPYPKGDTKKIVEFIDDLMGFM